jgi:hypothetical protein
MNDVEYVHRNFQLVTFLTNIDSGSTDVASVSTRPLIAVVVPEAAAATAAAAAMVAATAAAMVVATVAAMVVATVAATVNIHSLNVYMTYI